MNALKIKGVTLPEFLLVLAIGMAVIVMGLRQYQARQKENNYRILRNNVENLFVAMKNYYYVNCPENGTLYPKQQPSMLVPVPVTKTDLTAYFSRTWPLFSSVVYHGEQTEEKEENAAADSGYKSEASYLAQFNPIDYTNKNAYVCNYFGTDPVACSQPEPIPSSKVLLWQAQVAVLMANPAETVAYLGVSGADCAVNEVPTDIGVDCSTGITEGEAAYLVWQRLPSFASPELKTVHWLSNPRVKMLNLQYTHDPMYENYNPSDTSYQYYVCGG